VFLIYAGGLKFVLLSAILYAPGTVLYVWARREQRERVFNPAEWLIFAVALVAAGIGFHGLASGWIAL
jgi:arginine:ornithine antiporter/lysine permease